MLQNEIEPSFFFKHLQRAQKWHRRLRSAESWHFDWLGNTRQATHPLSNSGSDKIFCFSIIGVLLLNAVKMRVWWLILTSNKVKSAYSLKCLTVRKAEANSHKDHGWEMFTDSVIKAISANYSNVVFMLWGAYAQKKSLFIDTVSRRLEILTVSGPE